MTCLCTKSLGSTLLQTFLLPDAHTRRKRPSPLPCEVSKCRTPGLAVLTWGGGIPKESVNPCPGTKRSNFLNFAKRTFLTCRPRPESVFSPLPLGWRRVQAGLRAWCPRPHLASPAPGNACIWRRPKRRPFPLVFPYITKKGKGK